MRVTQWDHRWMQAALLFASFSKDKDKKVGAALVSPDRRELLHGYNGFPSRIADTVDRLTTKQLKNSLMIHAEVNAILKAKCDLTGWTIYCTNAICHDCALIVIQAGISRVVCPPIASDSSWATSCGKALILFREAKVSVTFINSCQTPLNNTGGEQVCNQVEFEEYTALKLEGYL